QGGRRRQGARPHLHRDRVLHLPVRKQLALSPGDGSLRPAQRALRADSEEVPPALRCALRAEDGSAGRFLQVPGSGAVPARREIARRTEADVAEGEAFVAEGEKRLGSLPVKIELRSELSKEPTYQQLVARITDNQLAQLLGVPFVSENLSTAFQRIQGDTTYAA